LIEPSRETPQNETPRETPVREQTAKAATPRTAAVLSIRRTARLLETIGELGEAGISDLARRLGWTKSTVHRLAATLEELGYLEQDETTGRYRLGLKLFELGSLVLRQRELRREAAPVMELLMQQTQETVHMAVLDERTGEIVYVHKVEPLQAIRLYTEIGAHHPAYCAATGKVLLAFLPEDRLERLLERLSFQAYTPRTITDPLALRTHLADIRARGYAIDDAEYKPDVRGVAAPVRDHRGQVIAAVNAGGPASRLTLERAHALAPLVQAAAQEISRRLGYLEHQPQAAPALPATGAARRSQRLPQSGF
jgi:DNA-binding IclR family transcriptional regulator